jgi:hypothetical protein
MSRHFNDVNITNNLNFGNNLSVFNLNQGFLNITGPAGTFSLGSSPKDTFYVAKNGSDATGNGTITNPYLTVGKGLLAASGISGGNVWVFPGTYEESITIPDNISLRGKSTRSTTIQRTNVSSPTTLVTMGNNVRVEDINFYLSSTGHNDLIGITFPKDSAYAGKLRTITLTVDNSSASSTGSSNVYGIYFPSDYTTKPPDYVQQLRACSVTVNSIGAGAKRALYETGHNFVTLRDTNLYVYDYSATGSTGTYYGAEINNSTGTLQIKNSTCYGANTIASITGATGVYADISQSTGTIQLTGTDLVNSNANFLGFTATVAVSEVLWGIFGAIQGGANKYLFPGTTTKNEMSDTPVSIITNSKKLIFLISNSKKLGNISRQIKNCLLISVASLKLTTDFSSLSQIDY